MFSKQPTEKDEREIARIRRYEEAARRNPQGYRRKVIAAAIAGYAAPFGFLAVLAICTVLGAAHVIGGGHGAGWVVKLSAVTALIAIAVARSMIVDFGLPDARRVMREEAPDLFAMLDEVRDFVNGPDIDEVYLDNELNAAIQQAPRFGIFGGHCNRLIIGLPLMQALTRAQFKGVIAHEYGHLAGAHGKTTSWIYRTRVLWAQLHEKIHEHESPINWPLTFFMDRYVPYFERLSFPLARENEFEADRSAADMVSGQTAADALMRINLAARYLEEVFWPSVDKHAHICATPNVAPLRHSHKAFAKMRAWPQNKAWLREIMDVETGFADTHPSIKDRLAALKAHARLTPLNNDRAIDLLGDLYENLRADFDAEWRDSIGDHWREAHQTAQKSLQKLSELDRQAELYPLPPAVALERAALAKIHLGDEAALHRYKEAVVWDDKNADAWLAIGALLASNGNERALKCLEKATSLADYLRFQAASARYQYYSLVGDTAGAKSAMEEVQREGEKYDRAQEESETATRDDTLHPHDLTDEQRQSLIRMLDDIPDIKSVYIVYKQSTILPHLRGYFLIIVPVNSKTATVNAVTEAIASLDFDQLEIDLNLWMAVGANRWMAKTAQAIDGAEIDLTLANAAEMRALENAA